MSVHEETRPDGTLVYKVRWREHGRQKGRTFNPAALGGKRAAQQAAREFDGKIARAQALGDTPDLDRGRILFDAYVNEWLDRPAFTRLAESTQDSYALLLDTRLIPEFGGWPLRDITPAAVEAFIGRMRKTGTGDPTILRALAVMQSVLKRAVVDGHIPVNPVAQAEKPRQARTRDPLAIAPVYVERMRLHLIDRGQLGDAALVCLLAYAGPRPESEALPLTWPQVRKRTLLIHDTKRHARRTTPIEEPLAQDLADWRAAGGNRISGLVFPYGRRGPGQPGGHVAAGGGAWTGDDYDNWRNRVFRPAAVAAGLPADSRPRDLRGSYATLLIHEGLPVTEVARRLGHSAQTCLKHYASVFEEFDPADRAPAADQIARARAAAAFPPGSAEEKRALTG